MAPNAIRPIEGLLPIMYPGVRLSYGTIQSMLIGAEAKARAFNARADVSGVSAGALDEMFSQGEPVLAGVDLDSGYLFALELHATRSGADWAQVLNQAKVQGLDLSVVVKDAAKGIEAGVREVFPEAEQRDDCFHALYEANKVRRRLEQRAYGAIAREVEARVDLVAKMLSDAGAIIDEDARPGFTAEHSNDTYTKLLQATMASRMPDADYDSLKEYVATLSPDDDSQGAKVLRAQVSTFKEWRSANELRQHLRWHWHEYFKNIDVLLTPMMATAAFAHDHRSFGERTLLVDNQERPYFEQVFWAGLTGVAYLPSTVVPTGLNDEGLPIGVQIVGPEFDDLITIGVAQELEAMGLTFTPPPAYLSD